jgi:hypothetical protein
MRRFDPETALAKIELEQMVFDYWREVDANGGRDIAGFFAEDGAAFMGPQTFEGHAGVTKFYEGRRESLRAQYGDVQRTSSHTVANLRISFENNTRAVADFLVVTYAANGKTPVLDATVPVSIGEVRFECRREADEQWRITAFRGSPLFLVGDDFVKKALGVK